MGKSSTKREISIDIFDYHRVYTGLQCYHIYIPLHWYQELTIPRNHPWIEWFQMWGCVKIGAHQFVGAQIYGCNGSSISFPFWGMLMFHFPRVKEHWRWKPQHSRWKTAFVRKPTHGLLPSHIFLPWYFGFRESRLLGGWIYQQLDLLGRGLWDPAGQLYCCVDHFTSYRHYRSSTWKKEGVGVGVRGQA